MDGVFQSHAPGGIRIRVHRACAAVVQDLRHVPYSDRMISNAQRQFIIMRTLLLTLKMAGLLPDVTANSHHTADVHAREQQVGGPVRFEDRCDAMPLVIEPVFIAVNQIGRCRCGKPMQCARSEPIIWVKREQVTTGSARRDLVQCPGNAELSGYAGNGNTRIRDYGRGEAVRHPRFG